MKKKTVLVLGLLIGGVSTSLWWLQTPSNDYQSADVETVTVAPEQGDDLEALFVKQEYLPVQETVDLSKERSSVAETRSMYQAHVSLRTPEVDDPDSGANTRVRSQMLSKLGQLADRHEARLAEKPIH